MLIAQSSAVTLWKTFGLTRDIDAAWTFLVSTLGLPTLTPPLVDQTHSVTSATGAYKGTNVSEACPEGSFDLSLVADAHPLFFPTDFLRSIPRDGFFVD